MTFIQTTDYFLEHIRADEATDSKLFRALGERESIGTTVAGEDIWRGNELTPAPTSHTTIPTPDSAGEQMTVVSESVNDTIAGSGVQKVRVRWLDETGAAGSEELDMDGTTGVDLVEANVRFVQDMYATQVGSGGVADDHIKIYKKTDTGLVYNMIAQGGNKSMVPHRMVPLDKILILKGWHATEAQGKRCAMRIRSTDMNGALLAGCFCFKDVAYLKQTTSGPLPLYERIPALSIVKVSAWAVLANAEASCSWWGSLEDA